MAAHNAHDQAAGVARALDLCDLYLGNEAPVVRKPGWSIRRGGKGVITGWRDDLWATPPRSVWHQAHKGSGLIPTPARGSLVTDGTLVNGDDTRVINGHRQNGHGWAGNKRRNLWRRRRDNWRRHDSMDRRLIDEAHRRGAHTLLGTDVNREDMPKPHPAAIPVRAGGITQLWYIPPADGEAWTVADRGAVHPRALGIDGTSHRLLWADLTI